MTEGNRKKEKEIKEAVKKTYAVKYSCINCGDYFYKIFNVGAKAPDYAKCVGCGINDSVKLT